MIWRHPTCPEIAGSLVTWLWPQVWAGGLKFLKEVPTEPGLGKLRDGSLRSSSRRPILSTSSPPNKRPTVGAPQWGAMSSLPEASCPPGQGLPGRRRLLRGRLGAGPPHACPTASRLHPGHTPAASPRARARARLKPRGFWGIGEGTEAPREPRLQGDVPSGWGRHFWLGTGWESGHGVCCGDHPQWQVTPGDSGIGQGARREPAPLRAASVWVPTGRAHPQVPGHLLPAPRPGRESPALASQSQGWAASA